MTTLVDTKTGLVLTVWTGEGPVSFKPYMNGKDNEDDYGAMEYDRT